MDNIEMSIWFKTTAGATVLSPKVVKSAYDELQTIAYQELAKATEVQRVTALLWGGWPETRTPE